MASERRKTLNAARSKAGEHAGPHGSFPITDKKSVNSAMRLAGHAEHPDVVRERVRAIAARKGLLGAIPEATKKRLHEHAKRGK